MEGIGGGDERMELIVWRGLAVFLEGSEPTERRRDRDHLLGRHVDRHAVEPETRRRRCHDRHGPPVTTLLPMICLLDGEPDGWPRAHACDCCARKKGAI